MLHHHFLVLKTADFPDLKYVSVLYVTLIPGTFQFWVSVSAGMWKRVEFLAFCLIKREKPDFKDFRPIQSHTSYLIITFITSSTHGKT